MKNSLDASPNGAQHSTHSHKAHSSQANGHAPLSRADFEAIADQLGLTIQDGDHRRGPNPFTGEGKDGFCFFFPEGNGTDRKGDFRKSRREMLERAGVQSHAASVPTGKQFDTRSLEERGLNAEARAHFQISGALGTSDAWGEYRQFPTFHPDGTPARSRRKFRDPARQTNRQRPAKTIWDTATKDKGQPPAYGLNWIEARETVYLVNSELAVWLFWQEGQRAICPLGEARSAASFRGMLQIAKDRGAPQIVVMLDNDDTGQNATARAIAAAHAVGLPVAAKQWPTGINDASDFWEACHAEGRDFRAALEFLTEAAPQPKARTTQSATAPQQTTPASAGDFPLDEIGNGQRFAAKHGEDIRFCSVRDQWLINWFGRWQPDEIGIADQRAKQIGRDVATEAASEADDDKRARLLKHALTLTKRATRETMLKDAASEPGMMVTPEQFDTNPHLFNCANITLDLQTHEAHKHDPRHLLTHQSPVVFDANAQYPTWRACMARWIPDEATRDFVQDAAGVSLSGQVFDEFFIFLYGDGDNGKSTFLRVLEWLLGTYSHKTQAETIMTARDQRKSNAPAPELLALKGARLVTVHEIDSKHQLNAALIKDLTGRDRITARGLFEKRETTFEPQFTLWMFGNSKPRISDTSGGMWRRPRLINFGQPIPAHERDPQLADKLRAELPGILNWALEGLRRVQKRGLIVPDAVLAATADYRAEQDPFAGFLADCCITGPHCTAGAGELWGAWCDWCRENGEREGTQRAFGSELTRRKFETYRGSTGRRWRGIGLKVPENPEKAPLPPSEPSEPSPFP